MTFLHILGVTRFRWVRRLLGGHWERWNIDWPVCALLWLDVAGCVKEGHPRGGLCRGTPECEDYR